MAKWIRKNNTKDIFCSDCGKLALGYPYWECDLKPSKYCPNCGEPMENGEEEDEDK